jgi:hypothetical protein
MQHAPSAGSVRRRAGMIALLFTTALTPASAARPAATATSIGSATAPQIDGDLSDSVWSMAKPVDGFYQTEPTEGAPASERTVVRILYDDDTLYFGITAYDGGTITARLKQRDAELYHDDSIRIFLDPQMTRRNAYSFQINPLGARRDGLIQNNTAALNEWNAIWTAKTRITPEGWSAEVAIPFRSISYSRGSWGFNVDREIRRKNEVDRWAGIDKSVVADDVSRAGTLEGIEAGNGGIGLDLQAFALTRYRKNWDGTEGTGISFRPSGNLFYKITPSLTGTLTYNTDFSDAPLDQRQVNTSRFSLFYPERRDFFLQDAAAFEFGGRSMSASEDTNAAPFFSRRIGIVNDQPVNILGGAKLSGDYDGFGIGALSVRTAGGAGAGEQMLSVVRLTAPVLEESKVGMILTNGDPTGASQNTVAGADFQYLDTHFLGNQTFQADAYAERSFSNRKADDTSFGLTVRLPNEPWNWYFRFKQIGANFDPALGFVARGGIREYTDITKYRLRFENAAVRWVEYCFWAYGVTGFDNRFQTRNAGLYAGLMTESGYYFQLEGKLLNERVPAPFDLPQAITVPAAEYTSGDLHIVAETPVGRLLSTAFDFEYAGFYGGRNLQTTSTVNFNPNETFTFSVRHLMQDLHMPHDAVTIQVVSLDAALNFTPDMQLRSQLQYDNISRNLEMSLRYRWEFAPGSELLVVAGEDAMLKDTYYRSRRSQFSVRLGKTFRF